MITLDFEWMWGGALGGIWTGEDEAVEWGLIIMLGPLFIMLEKQKVEE